MGNIDRRASPNVSRYELSDLGCDLAKRMPERMTRG
jgi:hypothetical protein